MITVSTPGGLPVLAALAGGVRQLDIHEFGITNEGVPYLARTIDGVAAGENALLEANVNTGVVNLTQRGVA